jgi:uncharacterized membrane protein/protein-disulfide isomerase
MNLEKKKQKKAIQPLVFGIYLWTAVAFAAVGLADSIYLSISHYRNYTDIGYESFCALSRAINCDTVSQSPYAIFLGIPVPVWGVIGYVFVLLLLLTAGTRAARPKRLWALLVIVALLYSGYSVVLAVISHFYIHSYCIMCIVSYGINFLLLFFSWLVWRRFEVGRFIVSLRQDLAFLWKKRQFSTAVFLPFFAGVMILWFSIPAYWSLKPEAIAADVTTGQTDDGHPWIGSEDSPLVITEFADYLCFQCNKMHYYLRQMATRYPGKIKIIHRHFPMDHAVNPIVQKPLHQGSGILALLAIYAGTEGRFWQMNDYLFANARGVTKIDLRSAAEAVGMDDNKLAQSIRMPRIRQQLHADIIDGLKLGIDGTPAFLIDGRLYTAQIPPEVLTRAIK